MAGAYHISCEDVEKIDEKAGIIAGQITESVNRKYKKEWPFFDDKEFEDVTKGIIPVPDNSLCLTGCHDICCPKECNFFSERLDSCGIYEFRSVSCRLFFCGDSEHPAVLRKLYDIVHSEVAWQTACDIIENEVDDKPSYFKRLYDYAKSVKERFESNEITPKEAKNQWRNIIVEYRNRKL